MKARRLDANHALLLLKRVFVAFVYPPIRPPELRSEIDSAEAYKRAHDHVSNAIDTSYKTFVALSLYCGLTIFSDFVGAADGNVKVPLADVTVAYPSFTVVSLVLILASLWSLHRNLSYWRTVGERARVFAASPLPYLFNRTEPFSKIATELAYYWVPVLVICLFMINVVHGVLGDFWHGHSLRNIAVLHLLGPGSICALLYLELIRASQRYARRRLFLWIPIVLFAYLPAIFVLEAIQVAVDPNAYFDW